MKQKFLIYMKQYHSGKEKAVSSVYLQSIFFISSRAVRRFVNQLRNDGHPICSDENGYYYAKDKMELLSSIGQMTSRIIEIAKAKNGLVKALRNFPDDSRQLSLGIDDEVEVGDEI